MTKTFGSITLCKEYNENTSTYLCVGLYDTREALTEALASFTKGCILGNMQIKKINCYTRPDKFESWYITYK